MKSQNIHGDGNLVAGRDLVYGIQASPYADMADEQVPLVRDTFQSGLRETTARYWLNRHFAVSLVIWLAAAACGGAYIAYLLAGRDMTGFCGAVVILGAVMVAAINRLERYRRPLDYRRRDLRQQIDLLDQETARRYRLSLVEGLS